MSDDRHYTTWDEARAAMSEKRHFTYKPDAIAQEAINILRAELAEARADYDALAAEVREYVDPEVAEAGWTAIAKAFAAVD